MKPISIQPKRPAAIISGSLLLLILLSAALAAILWATDAPAVPTLDEKVADVNVRAAYGKIPLSFEANHGQASESINFLARGAGYALALSPGEAVFALARQPQKTAEFSRATAGSKPAESASTLLRMTLLGSNPAAAAAGEAELGGKVNYFIGNDPAQWRRNVPTFERVRYTDVYPGIDVVYYGNQKRLEYDFVVAPGRDARVISLEFGGAESVTVDPATGDLLVGAGEETIRQHAPLTYQETANGRREVQSRYALKKDGRVGIEVGEYDTGAPLIIDPVLVYSTFLGGGSTDNGEDIAVDSGGNAYLTGTTLSTDFPTAGPIQSINRGGSGDAFVTKMNAAGTALVYSTYLGGTGQEFGRGIALDSTGNAYITGYTNASNFPTANPFQATIGGFSGDAFVAKIDATGANLVYSTYLGGTLIENGLGIAVDSAGNAYVTGDTASTNFPTVNPIQPGNNGSSDVFVTKINPSGSGLVYSTQLGGAAADQGFGIAVDSQGSAYITGSTGSASFPTVNPIFPRSTGREAFVAKLNAAGGALVYSSYLGGSLDEYGSGIAVDTQGNAYVTGTSASVNFPTANPIQPASGGGNGDVFVTKVNAAGSALVYSTYLGGNGSETAGGVAIGGIAVDSAGNAYVTGSTSSTNFPTANAIQSMFGGGTRDAFVTKINAAGSALSYSTYLGGGGADTGAGLALDSAGNAYITGSTDSANFPTVAGSFDTTNSGVDAFIAKISAGPPVVTGVVSRKVHGGAGPFDINLLTTPPGTECRTGGAGGNYQVVATFANPVSVSGLSIMSSNGMASGTLTVSGAVVTVDLATVANVQTLGITLTNVNDGVRAGDVFIPLGVLVGDTTGNGSVSASDVGQVKGQSGQPVTSANFRADVNVSGGSISASDIGLVKSFSGSTLP